MNVRCQCVALGASRSYAMPGIEIDAQQHRVAAGCCGLQTGGELGDVPRGYTGVGGAGYA